MVDALRHRGPDSAGFHRSDGYSAGARRLSINDLHGGDQPLYNEDRSVALVYNGEIYNSPRLRRELELRGHRFRTHSDGEVICHLYEELGEDLFEQLDGMFAVAVWSENERRLVLARDWPGEKPLYYTRLHGGGVAFASELKSLVLFPHLDLTLNMQALWDMPTFLWIPEPDTVYASIHALMPGETIVSDLTEVRKKTFRPESYRTSNDPLSDDDAIALTREIVTQAVRSRLLSDVPVGAFLSSGLDSSVVATVASRHLNRLTTFTIGFENLADPYGGHNDESTSATLIAKTLGTDHHVVSVTAEEFRRDLETFCGAGDQPFAVSSGLGILAIARIARESGIRVLLSGDGADECFGGYPWYFHLGGCGERASTGAEDPENFSFQNFGIPLDERLSRLARMPAPRRAWAWHYYASEAEKRALFSVGPFEKARSSLRYFEERQPGEDWPPEEFIRQDRGFYFPFEMLRKVDRMTMACSVESRAPFAAGAVMALAERLSYTQMLRGRYNKWVLREAFREVLPEDVIERPKHGFNVPIDHWLNGAWSDLLQDAFCSSSKLSKSGLISARSGEAARAMLADPHRLNGHTLFSLVMMNMWLEDAGRGARCP